MSQNPLPFYGGMAAEAFLSENDVLYSRLIENKACLFAEKNEESTRVYLLDFTMGLFLLNEKEIRLWLGLKRITAGSLDKLTWKELQVFKRNSQLVVVNYFQQYADLLDNFPEINEYEAVVRQAEDYKKQAPVSNLSQKYFWQFVETAFIFGNCIYSEKGVSLDFSENKKISGGRAKKQLKILQENGFLRFEETGKKTFTLRFNRHALHIDFVIAPHFFRHLVYDEAIYQINPPAQKVAEPSEKYQVGNRIPKRSKKRGNADKIVTEAQFLEQYLKQVELGKISEKRVLEAEIKFLNDNHKSELAQKVRSVADRPGLGFDIISYETDGREKQIEVKTVQQHDRQRSFIISKNELEKSGKLPNYYLYCVENPYSEFAKIFFFRQPDFENSPIFEATPLSFEIRFELKNPEKPEDQ